MFSSVFVAGRTKTSIPSAPILYNLRKYTLHSAAADNITREKSSVGCVLKKIHWYLCSKIQKEKTTKQYQPDR